MSDSGANRPAGSSAIGADDGDDRRDATGSPEDERLELAAQVELLAVENRRLRRQYARLRRTRYRRTAVGLLLLGALAALGGLVLPDGREVLFALAATGLFGAVLVYSLNPGRFVAADVGERLYAATAANAAAIVDALGLREEWVYLPGDDGAGTTTGIARLYVPQRADDDRLEELTTLADRGELDAFVGPFLTDGDRRGLVLEPNGAPLVREFERDLVDELASTPGPLVAQLTDGIVEGFELADTATPDVDADDGRATVAVTGSVLDDVDRFDHPIASFLAAGVAVGLERPVTLEVDPGGEGADWLVTCRWVPEATS